MHKHIVLVKSAFESDFLYAGINVTAINSVGPSCESRCCGVQPGAERRQLRPHH